MLRPRTLKILAALVALYGLLVLGAYRGPAAFEPLAVVVMIPYLSLHLFNKLGLPGLLEHGGLCGWGMCAPTPFGWAFLALLWLAIAWLAASGLAALTWRLAREAK